MRANTIIMVLLAIVFGVVAVVLSNMWLSSQRSALASTSGDKPSDTLVVAAVPLKFGDVLSADKLREIAWPVGARPAGSFKTAKELLDAAGENRQALQAIGANEPVLATKITGPGQRATLSAVLTEGMRAVSIRVNDVLGVAGFVLPGDRVDILLSRNTRDDAGNEQSFVDVLLQSVKVLAVDQVADESKENPEVVKAVTVEVDTKDAQKLTLAAGAGQLSLALRQAASSSGEQTQRVTLADLSGDAAVEAAKRKAEMAALEAGRKAAEERAAQAEQLAAQVEADRKKAAEEAAKREAQLAEEAAKREAEFKAGEERRLAEVLKAADARKSAEERRLAAERERADAQFGGLRQELVDLRKQFGDSLDNLKLQPAAAELEVKEVVKEVVKYIEPARPTMVSVGVIRGNDRAVYEVPSIK